MTRDLRSFTGEGYDKGRSVLWQAAWFAVLNLVFVKWWLPPRLRPPLLRLFGASVGERVLIRHRVRVLWPWKLTIGDDCWIGEGAWLLNLEPITLADDVCISQEALLCTGSPRGLPSQPVVAVGYRVGTVPPSIRYSAPAIEADRGDARKAIKSATSCGLAGRPTGIPPSQSMMIFLPPS